MAEAAAKGIKSERRAINQNAGGGGRGGRPWRTRRRSGYRCGGGKVRRIVTAVGRDPL